MKKEETVLVQICSRCGQKRPVHEVKCAKCGSLSARLV